MEFNTPYYVINKNELDDNFEKLVNAMKKYWGNYIIGYSYKTNALPWVIKHFDSLGCYAEVVSEHEYNLAKLIGVDKSKIIYNGPIKTKESYIEALENNCIVNIDSNREIEWLKCVEESKRNIGIRVNFDIEKKCKGQSQCGDEGGRFGFCYENGDFVKVVEKLKNIHVNVCGLHLHVSSKSRGLEIYRSIAEMACKIQDEYGLKLKYVDVGGGFFGGLDNKPQFEDYISLMSSILMRKFNPKETILIIEPGMAVVGSPISYVTSVIDIKDTNYNRFVVTDGSRTSIDPLMTKSSYFHKYEINNPTSNKIAKQVICGYTCMEHDRLFVAEDENELLPGDKIIYNKVGAYTMSLTPLFIKYFPDVYVKENDEYKKVRESWNPENYVMNSQVKE